MSATITDSQLQRWERDGYLLLRQIVPADIVNGMRAMFARVTDRMIAQLKSEGLVQDGRNDLPFETRFAVVAGKHAKKFGRSWRKGIAEPEVYALYSVPALVELIGKLTGTDVIGHPVFNGRPKLPGQDLTVVPWHQDSGYFGPDSANSLIITCWVPLVPVDTSNGCLQVIPGSHRQGIVSHREEDKEGKFLMIDDSLIDESRAVTCVMQPGDALLLHNLTFHRSLTSISPTIRWSIDIRYLRDGDHPGSIYWQNPADKWVLHSKTQPVTPLDQWLAMTKALPW